MPFSSSVLPNASAAMGFVKAASSGVTYVISTLSRMPLSLK